MWLAAVQQPNGLYISCRLNTPIHAGVRRQKNNLRFPASEYNSISNPHLVYVSFVIRTE
jgi:hypothetical protein